LTSRLTEPPGATKERRIAISPNQKTVGLRNVKTGEVTTESYDNLVLSPRAPSVHPPLPGINLPGILHVRTVPDARAIRDWVERGTTFLTGMYKYSGIQAVKPVRRAVVVGGGFIGLETAENLVHIGYHVTLIQKPDQVLGPIDPEIARLRSRLGDLPRDREILVFCRSGQRAYYATRVLLQHGFKARNLTGGTLSRAMLSLGKTP
jgi:NADPH-dependent 2,4-dienoyl-CoA reductase/sulfur reductase-like enzyme